jgi:hypothetical protein
VLDQLNTIAITIVHGVFRSVNLDTGKDIYKGKAKVKGKGKMRDGEDIVAVAQVASRLLSPYNATNNDDEEGLRSRHSQVPIIEFNGREPVKCPRCSEWTWEISICDECDAPHLACCGVVNGQCGVCEYL